jgi:hypothetical protein
MSYLILHIGGYHFVYTMGCPADLSSNQAVLDLWPKVHSHTVRPQPTSPLTRAVALPTMQQYLYIIMHIVYFDMHILV